MAIRLERLEKTYPESEQPVLTDVSVEVKDGEFFVIVGPRVVVRVPCYE